MAHGNTGGGFVLKRALGPPGLLLIPGAPMRKGVTLLHTNEKERAYRSYDDSCQTGAFDRSGQWTTHPLSLGGDAGRTPGPDTGYLPRD